MFNYHYIKYMYYSYFLFLIYLIQQHFQIYYRQHPPPQSYNSCLTLYESTNILRYNRIVHLPVWYSKFYSSNHIVKSQKKKSVKYD